MAETTATPRWVVEAIVNGAPVPHARLVQLVEEHESLQREAVDTAWRLCCLLDELTSGRMSKHTYSVEEMVAEIERSFAARAAEAVEDV